MKSEYMCNLEYAVIALFDRSYIACYHFLQCMAMYFFLSDVMLEMFLFSSSQSNLSLDCMILN